MQDYIAVKEKYARYMPHSAGRWEDFFFVAGWKINRFPFFWPWHLSGSQPRGSARRSARSWRGCATLWWCTEGTTVRDLEIESWTFFNDAILLSFSWLLMSNSVSDHPSYICLQTIYWWSNLLKWHAGKKLMTVRIVKHAFEIIHLLTGENPLQVKLLITELWSHNFC